MNFLKKMRLSKKSGTIMHKKRELFLIFSLPIIITFLFELLSTQIYIERFYNFIENLCFTYLLILPAFIIKKQAIKIFYLKTLYIFLAIMLFLETGYYFIFNSKFSPSSIFIISETNFNEAKEFLLFYLNIKMLLLLFILIIVTIYFLLKSKDFFGKVIDTNRKLLVLILFVFFSILLLAISYTRRENLPFLIAKSFYDLNKDSYFDDYLISGDSFGPFTENFKNESNVDETIVIIIGESISKRHLNIYGYERNTTPLLSKLKEEILIYNDVVSANSYTTAALSKALILDKTNGTIIQLLNKAGFKTYWLSNQNPIGLNESLVSKIAKSSDNKSFITASRFDKNIIYDEELLVELDDALKSTKHKKIIFIHLQGAHFDYKYRYPKNYNYFIDAPKSKFSKSEETNNIVNAYDNAILYHDFILNSIIIKVKNENISSAILYFSDHGEEVYDTMEFTGHNDDVGSIPMFQIPFLLWQSESFKSNNEIDINLDRSYMTDDLFHSIADLCNINSNYVDLEKSIFSKKFKKRKRIILNNKDYDSILNVEKNKN